MRKAILYLIVFSFCHFELSSQSIGIGTATPNTNALLDLSSDSKGLLIPRLTTGQRIGIVSPPDGLLVYDQTDQNFYFYNGGSWQKLLTGLSSWTLTGNTAINPALNFIGTTDNNVLQFKVNNIRAGLIDPVNRNALFGKKAGLLMLGGSNGNTIIGDSAAPNLNAFMTNNTIIGYGAMAQTNAEVHFNTIVGNLAGRNNTAWWACILGEEAGMVNQGHGNTFLGSKSGMLNSTGVGNTFVGNNAGRDNTTAIYNTILGNYAGQVSNGSDNVLIGMYTAFSNTTGFRNNLIGSHAGYFNTTGSNNLAIGYRALYSNNTGRGNIAIGNHALYSQIGGLNHYNTAIGDSSFYNSIYNSLFGFMHNTGIGASTGWGNVNGIENTYAGYGAGYRNDSAIRNTFVGAMAGRYVRGQFNGYNTFTGAYAGYLLESGSSNAIYGAFAAHNKKVGRDNCYMGYQSAYNDSSGLNNCFYGSFTGNNNGPGSYNVLMGYSAGYVNTANLNTFVGTYSGYVNTTGTQNAFFGGQSFTTKNTTGSFNTFIGSQAGDENITGNQNTMVGYNTDFTASNFFNATAIGAGAIVDASNKVRVGNIFVTSIGGQVGWTTFSDGRYKDIVQDDVKGIPFVMGLRPVSYIVDVQSLNGYYQQRNDSITKPMTPIYRRQTGFIAQEVDQLTKSLGFEFSGIDRPQSADGMYGLRYSEFVVPLVKAVQEQQKIIEELKKRIEVLEGKK